MNREEEAIYTLKRYALLSQQNCYHIAAWLIRSNFFTVAIFTPNYEALDKLLINELAAQNAVNVEWLFTNESTTYNSWKTTSCDNVIQMDGVDAVIVPESTLRYLRESQKPSMAETE